MLTRLSLPQVSTQSLGIFCSKTANFNYQQNRLGHGTVLMKRKWNVTLKHSMSYPWYLYFVKLYKVKITNKLVTNNVSSSLSIDYKVKAEIHYYK